MKSRAIVDMEGHAQKKWERAVMQAISYCLGALQCEEGLRDYSEGYWEL
jgi:hypothetical protein